MRGKLAVPDYEEAKAAAEKAREEQERQAAAARERASIHQEYSTAGTPNPYANYSTTRDTYPGESAQRRAMQQATNRQPAAKQPVKAAPKVGRNDPCPCGSGKKYKNCCGKGL